MRENSVQNFNSGYGVHFDTNMQNQYILFEDKLNGSMHVHDAGDIDLQTFTIEKGNKIGKICIDGVKPCTNPIVDISFSRPNPDAYIYVSGSNHAKAEICVTSPQGLVRKIIVDSTGQISVDADASGVCS